MRLFYLIILFYLSVVSNAQCGTDIQHDVKEYYIKRGLRINSGNNYQIPVKLHIIQASSGFGGLDSLSVVLALEEVNNKFLSSGIQFFQCSSINYIMDNNYLYFVKNSSEDVCELNDRPNVLNIYFAPELVKISDGDTSSLCGYAYMSGSKDRIIMDNDCATNGTTLSHEVGHYFSLYHTHEDDFGDEYADGSNCSIAGDLLCDTPADPKLSASIVNTNCQYVGTDLDPKGDTYNPDVKNLMAYGRKICREYFSPLQHDQMNYYAETFRNYLSCWPAGVHNKDHKSSSIKILANNRSGSIEVTGLEDKGYTLEILDILGRQRLLKSMTKYNNSIALNIGLNNNSELFFIRLYSDEKIIKEKKILL